MRTRRQTGALNDAEPPVNVAVPNEVAPSKNSTDPVGTPAGDVTPAVNVTDWPKVGLDGATPNDTAVAARLTCWVNAADVLFSNAAGSADTNTAVIECAPARQGRDRQLGGPEVSTGTGAPNDVAPSKNSTVPTGTSVVGATALTVAVNNTGFENTDGFDPLVTTVAVRPVSEITSGVVGPTVTQADCSPS